MYQYCLAGKEVEIKTIAICGGSGADDLEQLAGRVDAYITGDSKHRHAKYALDHDIVLIDVPHHLEVIMEKRLASLLSNLGITVKEANSQDYYSYYKSILIAVIKLNVSNYSQDIYIK